jgi:hypothetical protein
MSRKVIKNPLRKEVQPDGRISFWGKIDLCPTARPSMYRLREKNKSGQLKESQR